MNSEETRICSLEDALKEIKEDIKAVKENHLAHIQVSMASIQSDMAWLKGFFWIIASTSITAILGAILALIIK